MTHRRPSRGKSHSGKKKLFFPLFTECKHVRYRIRISFISMFNSLESNQNQSNRGLLTRSSPSQDFPSTKTQRQSTKETYQRTLSVSLQVRVPAPINGQTRLFMEWLSRLMHSIRDTQPSTQRTAAARRIKLTWTGFDCLRVMREWKLGRGRRSIGGCTSRGIRSTRSL